MTRQVTDQLYIELGYFTPEEYYTYQAEAISVQSAESTINAVVGKLYDVVVTCDALFSPNLVAQAIKNHDAVLDVVSAVTVDANVIRDLNAILVTQANIDQFVGHLYALRGSLMDSQFAQTVTADRIRYDSANLSVETTISAISLITGPTGITVEAVGNWSSLATSTAIVTVYRTTEAILYADVVCDPDGVQRIRAVDSTQSVVFTQTTDNLRLRYFDISANVEFTQTALASRILEANIACDALFSPSIAVNASKNVFAVLDSTSALAAVANANRSADVTLSNIITLSLQAAKFTDYVANLTSIAELESTALRIQQLNIDLNSTASISIDAVKQVNAVTTLSSVFTKSSTLTLIKNISATLTVVADVVTDSDYVSNSDIFVAAMDIAQGSALDTCVDTLGNVYSIGYEKYGTTTDGYSNDQIRILLTKHTARGRLLWQKNVGNSTSTSDLTAKIVYKNDYLYIAYSNVLITASLTYPLRFAKINATTGLVSWRKSRNTATNILLITDLVEYNDYFYALTQGLDRAQVYRLDDAGNIWSSTVDNSSAVTYRPQTNKSKFTVAANGIYVPLIMESTGFAGGNFVVAALAGGSGVFKSITNFEPTVIRTDTSGNIYMAGRYGTDASATYVICKLDSSYNVLWAKKDFASYLSISHFDLNTAGDLVLTFGTNLYVISASTGNVLNSGLFSSPLTKIEDINIAQGYVQFAGTGSSASEYLVGQVEEDLGGGNFIASTITWTQSGSQTLSDITLTVTTDSGTVSAFGSQNSNFSTTTSALTTTTYTENPIFVRKTAEFDLQSLWSLLANNVRKRSASVALSSTGTILINAINKASGTATLTTSATCSINGGYIRGATVSLATTSTLTTQVGVIKQFASDLSTNTEIFVDEQVYRSTQVNFYSEVTSNINLDLIKRTPVVLDAFNSELALVNKIGQGLIQLDTVSTQITIPVKTVQTPVVQTVVLTQVVDSSKIARIHSDITAQAQITVDALKLPGTNVVLSLAFTQVSNTDQSRIRECSAALTTEFTQSALPYDFTKANAVLNAETTLTNSVGTVKKTEASLLSQVTVLVNSQASRTRYLQAQLGTQLAQTTIARVIVDPKLVFQAIATEMVIGSKIAFDKHLQYRMPKEQTTYLVPEENRIYLVLEENRVNMIRG